MKYLTALLLMLWVFECGSKPMYKCSRGNFVQYQFKPCNPGEDEVKYSDSDRKLNEQSHITPVEVGELSVKFDHEDMFGNAWFVYKSTVINHTDRPFRQMLRWQATSYDGFHLFTIMVFAAVDAHSSTTITNDQMMPIDKWNNVFKWERLK